MLDPTLHHVECGGQDSGAVPMLALHGWWPDHRLMLGCLEPVFAAKPGYRRLYPDVQGMGATPAPPWFVGSDDMLSAVQGFVDDEIGDQPFLLVGQSYGGYLVDGLDADLAEDFATTSVVQTPQTLQRYRDEIAPGVAVADPDALERVRQGWALSPDPDADGQPPFEGPTLILAGRQDHAVGYLDQWRLLPHYPRATFAVLDLAGHNLQIEQPALFTALMSEWLDRVVVTAR